MGIQRPFRLLRDSLLPKGRSFRLASAFLLFIALFCFLHFKEVYVEILELDATADGYIVARVDFTFPDDETTLILQRQALADISPLYALSSKAIEEAKKRVENDFIHQGSWRAKTDATFDQIYRRITVISDQLREIRIVDSRTLKKVKETGYKGLLFIDIPLDSEQKESLELPPIFWSRFSEAFASAPCADQQMCELVLNQFAKQKNWEVRIDHEELRKLRTHIESLAGKQLTSVKAGSLILSEGDVVTHRHIRQLQEMKKELTERQNLWGMDTMASSAVIALLLTSIVVVYLRLYHPEVYRSKSNCFLYLSILLLVLFYTKSVELLLLYNGANFSEFSRFVVIVPLCAILVSVLLNKQIAIFSSFFFLVLATLSIQFAQSGFLLINFVTALAAIFFAESMNKRKEVFKVCFYVWLISLPIIFACNFASGRLLSLYSIYDLVSSFAMLMLEATIIALCLPLFESIFHVVTDLQLMELMDPNNRLIRRLCLEAPGTYQHSMMVGILAESAAIAIGANGLFCRVSALFHDIGKLFNPNYFTENQLGDFNIHDLLTPVESAMVIIAHVAEGVELAEKEHLPKAVIDVIQQHHGTTMVSYFYQKEVKLRGGNEDSVDCSLFTYPGPKPQTKEAALVMIADSVEAASRSLSEITEKSAVHLVDRLIFQKISEGQFAESAISLQELEVVKKIISQTLYVSRHGRIAYRFKE